MPERREGFRVKNAQPVLKKAGKKIVFANMVELINFVESLDGAGIMVMDEGQLRSQIRSRAPEER